MMNVRKKIQHLNRCLGGDRRVAEALGVCRVTVTRWRLGQARPASEAIRRRIEGLWQLYRDADPPGPVPPRLFD